MPRSLTIFIDGVPHDQLHKMPFARGFKSRARLVPILGYSVNCQTMLFTGKNPDEIGFWCEFSYDPEHSPFRRIKALLPLLALSEVWYPTQRVVHKVLDKLGWFSSTKNIPIRYLADFSETGHSVFDRSFDKPSLLGHPEVTSFLHWQFPNDDQRDEVMFEAAKRKIEQDEDPGHIVLMLSKLDMCSHWEGVASEPYERMLQENDRYIRELTSAFLERCPDGVVFVVSDHGMSNVDKFIRLDLEKKFGKPSASTYSYFSEGTLLRLWFADDRLRAEMSAHLAGIEGLERFGDDERREHGITRPEYGDLIYHTHESYMLLPSFWGPKPSIGMHGHHPRFPSQHGICLSTREGDFEGEVRAGDFYEVLAGCIEG
jgi:predicted AlkP superfamily pyrophosphatase or phosphodiesterase